MRRHFEDWMVRVEMKSKNTVYQYASSIEKISQHYSKKSNELTNIYSISDAEKVEYISNYYKKDGKFSSFGDRGNGTVRNSIATYLRYLQSSKYEDFSTRAPETETVDKSQEVPNFTYERDLKYSLTLDIPTLFPGFKMFGSASEGVEYSVEGKFIDVLLENEANNDLKVIELKSGVANYKAFGQICMYIGLLGKKFPDRKISGVIIAGTIDDSLTYACLTTNLVSYQTYQMKLELNNV